MGRSDRHLSYRERLLSRFEVTESGCWEWTGTYNGYGYGAIAGADGRTRQAHRAMWLELVGPLGDEGLELDHVCHSTDPACPGGSGCRHRGCVNPAHLEPVTREQHVARTRARRKEGFSVW